MAVRRHESLELSVNRLRVGNGQGFNTLNRRWFPAGGLDGQPDGL